MKIPFHRPDLPPDLNDLYSDSIKNGWLTTGKQVERFENKFTASVKELIYLGDHIRIRLNVCGNEDFIVKVANEGTLSYKEGDSINIGWQARDIRALDYRN